MAPAIVVDGGLGAELQRRGFSFETALWSAEAVLREPALVTAVHRDFLSAGARVVETATYQMSHAALRALGYTDAAIDDRFALAVRLARDAVEAQRAAAPTAAPYVVAASLGPYGATVGDGSEYSGVRHLDDAALYEFHAERVAAVVRGQPDAIAFETIPSLHEALVIAGVTRDLNVPVWLSFSCPDGLHTYAGDRVAQAAAQLEPYPGIRVLGVNCTAPATTASLLREIGRASTKALSACPNLGQHWEIDAHGLVGGAPEAVFLAYVPEWLNCGVAYLGGCCGVGPATIGRLAAAVEAATA